MYSIKVRISRNTVDYRAQAQHFATQYYGQYGEISISASGEPMIGERYQQSGQQQQASSSGQVHQR